MSVEPEAKVGEDEATVTPKMRWYALPNTVAVVLVAPTSWLSV